MFVESAPTTTPRVLHFEPAAGFFRHGALLALERVGIAPTTKLVAEALLRHANDLETVEDQLDQLELDAREVVALEVNTPPADRTQADRDALRLVLHKVNRCFHRRRDLLNLAEKVRRHLIDALTQDGVLNRG